MTGYEPNTLVHAKAMRRAPTDAERALWTLLRAKRFVDFKFRRQQPIGPYIADFVCPVAKLIIEADGSQHADSIPDIRRSNWLEANGYRVLRIWNNDILARPASVSEAIYGALLTPSPSHAEGGAGPALSLKGRGTESVAHGS